MMNSFVVLLSFVLFVLTKCQETYTVETSVGKIQGYKNSYGVKEFKGIPYALPPVNDLRFEYPKPAYPFADTYGNYHYIIIIFYYLFYHYDRCKL